MLLKCLVSLPILAGIGISINAIIDTQRLVAKKDNRVAADDIITAILAGLYLLILLTIEIHIILWQR
jgi:hypothetical protein